MNYYPYSSWLKKRYGEKVYKLPVNLPVTCPNRDGTKGQGGCIFCGEHGGGHETLSSTLSIREQIDNNKKYIGKRYGAQKFIPYFQSHTNTYLPFNQFKEAVNESLKGDDIVGLSIATRPDVLTEKQLDYLKDVQSDTGKEVTVELGLQTANDRTLKILNRGHRCEDYDLSARKIKKYGLRLCTHVILDLPWDERQDVLQTVRHINETQNDFVKCHSLYVVKGTQLHKMYSNKEVHLLSESEFIERCILFLTRLNPETAVQRLIGRVPEAVSVVANWHKSWWKVRDNLEAQMAARGDFQGRYYRTHKESEDGRKNANYHKQ